MNINIKQLIPKKVIEYSTYFLWEKKDWIYSRNNRQLFIKKDTKYEKHKKRGGSQKYIPYVIIKKTKNIFIQLNIALKKFSLSAVSRVSPNNYIINTVDQDVNSTLLNKWRKTLSHGYNLARKYVYLNGTNTKCSTFGDIEKFYHLSCNANFIRTTNNLMWMFIVRLNNVNDRKEGYIKIILHYYQGGFYNNAIIMDHVRTDLIAATKEIFKLNKFKMITKHLDYNHNYNKSVELMNDLIYLEMYDCYPPIYNLSKFKNLETIQIFTRDFDIDLKQLTIILSEYPNIKEIKINDKSYLYGSLKHTYENLPHVNDEIETQCIKKSIISMLKIMSIPFMSLKNKLKKKISCYTII